MRILWLKTELLHPVDRGGRIRTYATLRALRRAHEITYLTLDDGRSAPDAPERAREYAQHLVRIHHPSPPRRSGAFLWGVVRNLASDLPHAVWRYRSEPMRRAVGQALVAGKHDVVVADFLFPMINVPEPCPVPLVLFEHNVEAMIWRRHCDTAGSMGAREYYRRQWRRLQVYEGAACRRADQVIAVSPQDADTIRRDYHTEAVGDVPTGVDTEFFGVTDRSAAQPGRLVFLGAMDWLPNEDGVGYFLDDILPRVRAVVPGVTFTVVGRNPSAALKARAAATVGVEITGTVADVRPYLGRSTLFVVPLRIGGGTRLKIFEAMAMGLPVVSTSIGAEGLPVQHGRDLVLADTASDFAAQIVRLLERPAEAWSLGGRGAALVRERFSWETAAERFAVLCEAAISIRRTRMSRTR